MARHRIQPEFGKRQDAIGAHCGGQANLTESSPIAHRMGTPSQPVPPYNRSNTVWRLNHMRLITFNPVPFVVLAALLSSSAFAHAQSGELRRDRPAAPSHKHYDDTKDVPAPAPGM